MNTLWSLALLSTAVLAAADPTQAFFAANRAYEEQKYEDAAKAYRELIAVGYGNAQVFYNLGNAELRLGKIGRALAAYRSSEYIDPRDEDLEANIAFIKEQAKDKVELSEGERAVRRLAFFYHSLSLQELIIGFLCCNALFWATALLRRRWQAEILGWLFWIGLGFSLLFAGSAATKSISHALWCHGVVAEPELEIRSGKQGTVLFALHEATEVSIEDSDGDWLKIALPDGKLGWVPEASIARIE